jgi:GMP synthase (glutamine-hydrolysing)
MMRIHFVMHESFEAPAAIEIWAQERSLDIAYTRLYEGDKFPEECDFDFLVIMGGPQSPETTLEECPHFDAAKETAFIQKAVGKNKLILGVCLGAQFIGHALGARVERSPHREIGVFNVSLTEDGKKDPFFSSFPETFPVGHWHGDMPGLTPDAKILAVSEGCPRQIVRYAPNIYGFQCHFEFNRNTIEDMIANSSEELKQHQGRPFIETEEQLRSHDYDEMNRLLFGFLDRFSAQPRPF